MRFFFSFIADIYIVFRTDIFLFLNESRQTLQCFWSMFLKFNLTLHRLNTHIMLFCIYNLKKEIIFRSLYDNLLTLPGIVSN